jgi:hypothetical protein
MLAKELKFVLVKFLMAFWVIFEIRIEKVCERTHFLSAVKVYLFD